MKFFMTGLVRHRKRLETYRIKTYNRYMRMVYQQYAVKE